MVYPELAYDAQPGSHMNNPRQLPQTTKRHKSLKVLLQTQLPGHQVSEPGHHIPVLNEGLTEVCQTGFFFSNKD